MVRMSLPGTSTLWECLSGIPRRVKISLGVLFFQDCTQFLIA